MWTYAMLRLPLGRRLLTAAVTLLGTLALSVTLVTAPSQAATGDLPASASDSFGCGKSMTSEATYFRAENRVVGKTVLSNNCQLAGFHGAVISILSDANDRVVAYGEPKRYGVDGRGPCYPVVVSWWPFRTEWRCPPTVVRPEYWQDQIDPTASNTATRLTLVQYPAPNSWLESLQSLHAHLDEAVAVGKTVAEVVAIIAAL